MPMLPMPVPITRDLVLIGGGHSHALVLRMWGMRPLPGVRLTLINPDPTAAYSGMLPGHVAGHYPRHSLEIDLVRLARFAGARLILARATGIDRVLRRVQIEDRAPVGYDLASIDIGLTSQMPALPGFAEHAVPAKPLGAFASRWEGFLADVAGGRHAPGVAVIGGGIAGVELALAVAHRLGSGAQVTLIEAAEPLGLLGRGARRALLRRLSQAGVTLATGSAAVAVTGHSVALADGREIPSAFTIGAAGAQAQGWLAQTGLTLAAGFVSIGPTLQSTTDPAIFAAGDTAHMTHAPRPKAGVFAVRQAPVLFHNLRVAASGQGRLRAFHPQSDYLKLVSAGGKQAVADKWGLPLDGGWIWRWKDRIDQRFMDKFRALPAMQTPAAPRPPASEGLSDAPLCGGCGAKVGKPALSDALDQLPPAQRADVVKGAGDDAAILWHGRGYQVITTDHLRAFWADPWLMARIAAIHALGDVWSMGARPQVALAQVILPLLAERQQAETLREIMAAAAEVFGPEGADIVGGHTSLGAELSLGFTVTGLAAKAPLTHGGAQAGDVLILTKAIGTGVILAAEMVGKASGATVAAALISMSRPQGEAARLLTPHAHAMTDVTGFGLAGHLLSILEASDLSARLDLRAVPLLPGAADLSRAGLGSSLLSANRQAQASMLLTDTPVADLLFDPQTAGGMLAAVPPAVANDLLARLQDMGETAAIIGALHPGPAFVTVEG